jgi:hypothetical protein
MAKKKETSQSRIAKAMVKAIDAFDEAIDPSNLSAQEAIDFTGEPIGELQIRLETYVQEANGD